MRDLHFRTGANLTSDDCCWFGLPPHTADHFYPDSAQPSMDASKMSPIASSDTANASLEVGYWGYRRSDASVAYTTGPDGATYPTLWTKYGTAGSAGITWPYTSPATGGLTITPTKYGATAIFASLGHTYFNDYTYHAEEWALEWMPFDVAGPSPINMSSAFLVTMLGSHDRGICGNGVPGVWGNRPNLRLVTSAPTNLCASSFRIHTHGYCTYRTLKPPTGGAYSSDRLGSGVNTDHRGQTASNLGTTGNPNVTAMSLTNVPHGIRQGVAVRLTPQPTYNRNMFLLQTVTYAAGNVQINPFVGIFSIPATQTLNYLPTASLPVFACNGNTSAASCVDRYTKGAIGNGSTPWSHIQFVLPRWAHTAPSIVTTAGFDRTKAIAGLSSARLGWSASVPNAEGYVGTPFEFNMTEAYALRFFADAPGETHYDNLTFKFAVWSPDSSYGSVSSTVFGAWKREGGWSQAGFVLFPANTKTHVINVTVTDEGWNAGMQAAAGFSFYDRSKLAGPASLVLQYYIAPQACADCAPNTFAMLPCRGRLQPAVCAACSSTCGAGSYIASPCVSSIAGAMDRTCASCASTCPVGSRLSKVCDGTDTTSSVCVVCARCPAGQYASSGCSAAGTADTVCSPCPSLGLSPNSTLFLPSDCALSLDLSPIVAAAASGGGGSAAVTCPTSCPPGMRLNQACGGGSPSICVACSGCLLGQYPTGGCPSASAGITDTLCTVCPSPSTLVTGALYLPFGCPLNLTGAALASAISHDSSPVCPSVCPPGQRLNETCNGLRSSVCVPCSGCPTGSYASGGCPSSSGGTADTACSPCPSASALANNMLYLPFGCPLNLTGSALASAIMGDSTAVLVATPKTVCPLSCPPAMRLNQTCGAPTPSVCVPCSGCIVGAYPSGGCPSASGGTADTSCSPCPSAALANGALYLPVGCPLNVTGSALASTILVDPATNLSGFVPAGSGAVRYRVCSACSDGFTYASVPCSAAIDTQCAVCSPACIAGSFASAVCTRDHDRTCNSCTSTCPSGAYLSAACSATADARCELCTQNCGPGTYRTAACQTTPGANGLGADTICSACNCSSVGSSRCDAVTGTCVCRAGFTGPRCDTCEAGVWGAACDTPCACTGPGSASTSCAAKDGKCTCRAGLWAGFYCDACAPQKYGPACGGTCACGVHGRCYDGLAGDGSCVCEAGWSGPTCTTLIAGPFAVYGGAPIGLLAAVEGLPFTSSLPSSAFVLCANNVPSTFSSSLVNVSYIGPAWLTVVRNDGAASGFVFVGSPTRADVTLATGPREATLLASTATGTASVTLLVAVAHVNRPPVFTALPLPPMTVRVGAAWLFQLKQGDSGVNDDDVGAFGDTLTVSLSGLPSWAAALPSKRTPDGSLLWTAGGTPPSAGSSSTVIVTVTDGAGASVFTSFALTVLTGNAALFFTGIPTVHISAGSTLQFVLPEAAFSTVLGPGSAIASYSVSGITPSLHPSSRRRAMDASASATLPARRLHALVDVVQPAARLLASTAIEHTTFADAYSAALDNARAEASASLNLRAAGRRLGRMLSAANEKSTVDSVDGPTTLAELDEADRVFFDVHELAPRPSDVQAAAERRMLSSLGSCAWLGTALSRDTVPRPLLWGTPGPDDIPVACSLTVTAVNEAGFAASGPVSVIVEFHNYPPASTSALSPFTCPALQVCTFDFHMSALFVDPNAQGLGSYGTDLLQFFLRGIGGAPEEASSFVSFTCTGGDIPGAISSVCSMRVYAPVPAVGSWGLQVVGQDLGGLSASLPLLLRITTPTIFTARVSPWSTCTAQCGGGTSFSSTSCVDYRGAVVDAVNCAAVLASANATAGPQSRPCNMDACTTAFWSAGPWSACSAPCALRSNWTGAVTPSSFTLPTASRVVACMAPNGLDVLSADACSQAMPATVRACNTQACAVQPTAPSDYQPIVTSCVGVIDASGVCCTTPAPSGVCCLATDGGAVIDDCGVCGGVNACPLSTSIRLSSPALAALLCGGAASASPSSQAAVQSLLNDAISTALGVSAGTIVVGLPTCVAPPSTARALASTTARRRELAASTSLSAALALGPTARLSSAEVAASLADRLPAAIRASTGYASSVTSVGSSSEGSGGVTRKGSCGNGLCEVGEPCLDSACDSAGTCAADCGRHALMCASDAAGLPCGGMGACQLSSGKCACVTGYAGSACDACASDYISTAGASPGSSVCIPVLANPANAAAPSAQPAFTTSAGFGSLVTLVALGTACAAIFGLAAYAARTRAAHSQQTGVLAESWVPASGPKGGPAKTDSGRPGGFASVNPLLALSGASRSTGSGEALGPTAVFAASMVKAAGVGPTPARRKSGGGLSLLAFPTPATGTQARDTPAPPRKNAFAPIGEGSEIDVLTSPRFAALSGSENQ